jgi:CMP-N-acetylneuraminic acid synthetase
MSTNSLITVYIPCHNYGRYLEQAVESVIRQTYVHWEMILINDGSKDDSAEIMARYAAAHPEKIRIISHPKPAGLQISANEALRQARGRYIMRLDADDYLDENAFLVLSHYLDQHPNIALVYPNYVYIDAQGNTLGLEQRKRVGIEDQVLDLPAHGACTMIRKRVLLSVGGYDERFDRQDGYDLWLKVINRYPVANIETPLFFYRQHDESLTGDNVKLLRVREQIKGSRADLENSSVQPRVAAIVGAKNTYSRLPNVVLNPLAGHPLIDYTLKAVLDVDLVEKVLVSTDDPAVVSYCQGHFPQVLTRLRPSEFSDLHASIAMVINDAVQYLQTQGVYPDILVWLGVNAPLRTAEDIRAAIHTLLLYKVDSVISVYEDFELHYLHRMYGLEALNPAMHRKIRLEREALFVDNGAVRTFWRDSLTEDDYYGQKVGHIVMPRYDSFQIKKPQDAWIIEQVLKSRQASNDMTPADWKEPGMK